MQIIIGLSKSYVQKKLKKNCKFKTKQDLEYATENDT